MSQLGISVGIAVLAVISSTVTNASHFSDKRSPDALMQGYRAVFWTCFAMMVISTLVGWWGLRGCKTIGSNKEVKRNAITGYERSSISCESLVQEHVVIERRALPAASTIMVEPRSGLEVTPAKIPAFREKPLPELPPISEQLGAIEVSSPSPPASSLQDIVLEPYPDYILAWYNRSQRSLVEGDFVIDDHESRETDAVDFV